MRSVTLDAQVPDAQADNIFDRLRDFAAYPRFTDAVREVKVTPRDDDTVESEWSVNFRNGVLRWTELDRFDPASRTISFDQTTGDFEQFTGTWQVEQQASTVAVRFASEFDLGMPSLAAMVDPIAEDALVENLKLIIRGLLGNTVTFSPASQHADRRPAQAGLER